MDGLLRYNGTVRRDPRIESWFSMTDPHRLMVRPWFEHMRDCGVDVRELFHDGSPIACVGDAPFGYVNTFKAPPPPVNVINIGGSIGAGPSQ